MVGRPLVVACVDRLQNGTADRAVSPVWLPPLPERLALARVIPDETRTSTGGSGPLQIPIGLLDDPVRQRQQPWLLDLSRSGGHVAVIGAPGTGRSTFLRTVAASMALTHTPREISIYGMDLTGGGLRRHRGVPARRRGGDPRRPGPAAPAAGGAGRDAGGAGDGLPGPRYRLVRRAARPARGRTGPGADLGRGGAADRRRFPAADRVRAAGGTTVRPDPARRQFRHPRRSRDDPLERHPDEPATADRHPAGAAPERPGGLEHRPQAERRAAGRPARPGADRGRPVRPDRVAGARRRGRRRSRHRAGGLADRSASGWEGPSAAPIRLLPASLDPAELPDAFDEPDAVPFGLRQDTMEPAAARAGRRRSAPARVRRFRIG